MVVAIGGDYRTRELSYWIFTQMARLRPLRERSQRGCADEGRWNIDGQTLCWDLSVGEQYGYKSACVRVQKVGPQDYQMHNVKGFRQFLFRAVK